MENPRKLPFDFRKITKDETGSVRFVIELTDEFKEWFNDNEEDSDEKKGSESISSEAENAISIKINNNNDDESDCDSDYPCPMSERKGFSALIGLFRPKRNSLYYESYSSEETEPIKML